MAGIAKAFGASGRRTLWVGAAGSLLLILSANNRVSGIVMLFHCLVGLFEFAFWFLVKFHRQAKTLVESINWDNHLRLDLMNLLG